MRARRLVSPRPRPAYRLRLDALEDRTVPATFVVRNTNDSGTDSLRQAILDSNASPPAGVRNEIQFEFSSVGVHTIQPLTPFPWLTQPVWINGYSPLSGASRNTLDVGSNAVLRIELDGTYAGTDAGLVAAAQDCVISGLVINRFSGTKVLLGPAGPGHANVLEGCYIGTDAAGTDTLGGGYGVDALGGARIGTDGNGDNDWGERNVIGGRFRAVVLSGDNNVVAGNYIGLGSDGQTALANTGEGAVWVTSGRDNRIGTDGSDDGYNSAERNVISGNQTRGVFVVPAATDTQIAGNYIGLAADGTTPKGNLVRGIQDEGSRTWIGTKGDGTIHDTDRRNVVSGTRLLPNDANTGTGISGGYVVTGNYIGTDATGLSAVGNESGGVGVAVYVGTTPTGVTSNATRNVISGNVGPGLYVVNAKVRGNYIGLGKDGITPVPNRGGPGIAAASNNQIGTNGDGVNDAAERNVVAANEVGGIIVSGADNVVAGNWVGVDVDGLLRQNIAPVRSGEYGVQIVDGGHDNRIEGNLIADGVVLYPRLGAGPSDNRIAGNIIGSLVNGAGYGSGGLVISVGENNIVEGNTIAGMILNGNSTGTIIANNNFGTNPAGDQARTPAVEWTGLQISGATGTRIEGNVFGGYRASNGLGGDAITLEYASDTRIENNRIGVGGSGNLLPNAGYGIYTDNEVQGLRITGNTIANSGKAGIFLRRDDAQVAITGNHIFDNGGLGIDLARNGIANGVDLNDSLDADAGPNHRQNFPVLTADLSGPTPVVHGTLASTPNTRFLIEVFANTARGDLGPLTRRYGEGRRPVYSDTVTTDGNGNASFQTTVLNLNDDEWYATATATRLTLDGSVWVPVETSEFSATAVVNPGGQPTPVAAVDTVRSGPPATWEEGRTTIYFTSAGSTAPPGEALSYRWEFGDGEFSLSPNPSHRYQDDGTFSVTLTVSTGSGGTATRAVPIVIRSVPPQAAFQNSGRAPEPGTVTVQLAAVFDPSPADRQAGIHYSISLTREGLAQSYAAATDEPVRVFSSDDQVSFPVYARAFDKDNDFTPFETTVTIDNLPPQVVLRPAGQPFLYDGELDPSYGVAGVAVADVAADERVNATAVQADGKTLLVGAFRDDDGVYHGHLVRLNPDGTPDGSFGSGGQVISPAAWESDWFGVIPLADGRILVEGYAENGDLSGVVLRRLRPDGSPDPTFGNQGLVETLLDRTDLPQRILLQPDGRILLPTGRGPMALARFTADGMPDAPYGSGGVVETEFSAGHFVGFVALPDNSVVAVGLQYADYPVDAFQLVLDRLDADGSLPPDHRTVTNLPISGQGNFYVQGNVVRRPSGPLVIGLNFGGPEFPRLIQVKLDGTLDPGFGTGGVAFAGGATRFQAGMALQSDGALLVSEWQAVSRYTTAGAPDTSFGLDYSGTRPVEALYYVGSLAVQPDGRILVSGTAYDFGVDPAVARTTVVRLTGPEGPARVLPGAALGFVAAARDRGPLDMPIGGFPLDWTVTRDGVTVATGSGAAFGFTPTAAGTYVVAVTTHDKDGATATARKTVTVLAMTTTNLQSQLPAGGGALDLSATTQASVDAFVTAANALTNPAAPVEIVVDLGGGTFTGQVLSPPANVTVTFQNGTFNGHSPAITVRSGKVVLKNVTLVNTTDAPSLLVEGGTVIVRGSTIGESTGFARAAVQVTGGRLDLGTSGDSGGNTLIVNGPGELIRNLGAAAVSALGNTFRLGTLTVTDGFAIEDAVFHAPDAGGGGLVTWQASTAFVTPASGSVQRAVDAVMAGGRVNVRGAAYPDFTAGAKPLTVAFSDGPTFTHGAHPLAPAARSLTVTGTPGPDDIKFHPGPADAVVAVVKDWPKGTFAPTGWLVADGRGGADDLQVVGGVGLRGYLSGGDGADRLKAGSAGSVLLGGAGDDLLVGGGGRDVLVGGLGADRLMGNAQDDVLIAGFTDFDLDPAGLGVVLGEWGRTDLDFAARVARLRAGVGSVALTDGTVHDDGVRDVLTGDSGQDWFLFNVDGDNQAARDQATDLTAFEAAYAQDLDFLRP